MKMDYEKQDELLFQAVDKLKSGNAESFNDVYELSKKYIYKIIYDVVKNNDVVEDLMQETYLQIYNKINTLENPRVFLIWAGRIATNFSLRYIQKQRDIVAADLTSEDGEEFVFDTVADDNEEFIPEAAVMDQEKIRLIGEILDGLSPEQKIAVQFFYYEEMSVRDIAKACGCSEGTIKSRLNYARKSIKEVVVDLDVNKNTRLYSLASLPVFYIVFRKEVLTVVVSVIEKFQILESILGRGAKETASTVKFATKTAEQNFTEVPTKQSPQSVVQTAQEAPQSVAQTAQEASQSVVQTAQEVPQSVAQTAQQAATSQPVKATATTLAKNAGKTIGTKIAIGATAAVLGGGGLFGGLIASGKIHVGKQPEISSEASAVKPSDNPGSDDKGTDKDKDTVTQIVGIDENCELLAEGLFMYMYTEGDGIVIQFRGGDDYIKTLEAANGGEGGKAVVNATKYVWAFLTLDDKYLQEEGQAAYDELKNEAESWREDGKESYPNANVVVQAEFEAETKATFSRYYEEFKNYRSIEYGSNLKEDWDWAFSKLNYATISVDGQTYVFELIELPEKIHGYLSAEVREDDPEFALTCGAKLYKVNK